MREIVANAGDEYGDMVAMGVLDPTKVTRTALAALPACDRAAILDTFSAVPGTKSGLTTLARLGDTPEVPLNFLSLRRLISQPWWYGSVLRSVGGMGTSTVKQQPLPSRPGPSVMVPAMLATACLTMAKPSPEPASSLPATR
jgi:hypothetical protein